MTPDPHRSPPIGLLATGSYLPDTVLTNAALASRLDTSDEWIRAHLGIRERRIAVQETTSTMATAAARLALSSLPDPRALDGLILATQTPDKPIPATACIVQHRLGLQDCFALDVNAACSGFVYALHLALGLLRGGLARRLLVIGAERMSRLVNWQDRRTCVIFGDGAGAALLGTVAPGEPRLADLGVSLLGADGRGEEVIHVPAGGASLPLTRDNLDLGLQYVHMDGRRVFDFAVAAFVSTIRELARRSDLAVSDLSHLLPHQANQRIIEQAMEELGLPADRAVSHLDCYGNTSAASIPIALDESARAGRFHTGEHLALVAFGTGLAWGGALLTWSARHD